METEQVAVAPVAAPSVPVTCGECKRLWKRKGEFFCQHPQLWKKATPGLTMPAAYIGSSAKGAPPVWCPLRDPK